MANYQELVKYIVDHLVTIPDQVEITTEVNDRGIVMVLIKVASEDVGRVIGKRGATINAIRLVAKAAAVKENERVEVDIEAD
ncbi:MULTISPECIES: KH domain-containing protein [Aminobacterium]|nr:MULTISPECIES: KH domain-containing protein [Aminobacterium]MDD2379243.1 KH domain-containing protein [Aminobacterium colombiense]MDD3767814.1 KH domain-containing protein [Aminobacterium colombiense]MDD4265554.1 KH domain-containing protein [Aminobacterium colombiense]MDD4585942.1 KH domain-containing protein [Aminobacterium colombiense]NLK29891.1 KH domain-containing protein [Aminobacterium colombiense]